MKTKTLPALLLKVAILAIALFICDSIALEISGLGKFMIPANLEALGILLIVYVAQAIVLSYLILHSRWTGWRLIAAVFIVFYGITTFLSNIETVVFLEYLVDIIPADIVPRLFLQGAITAALFSPLAVWTLGKMKAENQAPGRGAHLAMPWTAWTWKLALIAVLYVVIYFMFGMLVPILAGDAFETYYAGLQLPVWIFPFQMVRALIWVVLAQPVIWMMQGYRRQVRLATALLFSVLMGFQLLLPNEFMPAPIRMAHFVEVVTSNFLFGWIVVSILLRGQRTAQGAPRRETPAMKSTQKISP